MGDMLASQESRSTNARKSAFLSSGRRPGLDLHVLGRPNERPSQATKTLPPSMPNATFFKVMSYNYFPHGTSSARNVRRKIGTTTHQPFASESASMLSIAPLTPIRSRHAHFD